MYPKVCFEAWIKLEELAQNFPQIKSNHRPSRQF
ncbi:uncharacterized protein METZ01_LOCUS233033 [marine metagenome]|uniref:Uncharacterized protein n=1 Tax=marine metagenome TaxID=408172 RepID=A0A382GYX9_9ZZZZ